MRLIDEHLGLYNWITRDPRKDLAIGRLSLQMVQKIAIS